MSNLHEGCAAPEPHTRDEDCCVSAQDGRCFVCGADHGGDPCAACAGVAFHRPGCLLLAELERDGIGALPGRIA